MGLLALFSRPQRVDPVFGHLKMHHQAWRGVISIPELCAKPFQLRIEGDRTADFTVFYPTLEAIRQNRRQIRQQIAKDAFGYYKSYVEEDLKSGNYSKEKLSKYPVVTGDDDIWSILTPTMLTLMNRKRDYNWALVLDVNWPNGHLFVARFLQAELYVLDIDG